MMKKKGLLMWTAVRDTNKSDSVGASRATRSRARDTVESGVQLLERSAGRTHGDAARGAERGMRAYEHPTQSGF